MSSRIGDQATADVESPGTEWGPSVSLVLPCLNEAQSIALCIKEAHAGLATSGLFGEVIVVDNGSTDGSAEIAAKAGAHVVQERAHGYGSALSAGIRAARGEIVVIADADDTYDFTKLSVLLAPLLAGDADLVLGSRFGGRLGHTMPILHRRIGTPVLTFLIARASGGLAIRDSQSGYRAFWRDAVVDLDLEATGMEFASEMLIRAVRAGLRVREVETGYRQRIGDSKLHTFRDGIRHLQLISLLAPDLVLLGPGTALVVVGTLLSLFGIAFPAGFQLGSLRWQPVFFSSIALVLGTQMVLAGTTIANRSSVAAGSLRVRFAFASKPKFLDTCVILGVGCFMAGLSIDAGLFVISLTHHASPARGLALAALAQSLLIIGGSLVMFSIIGRWLARSDVNRPFRRRHAVNYTTQLTPHRIRSSATAPVDESGVAS
jgi:hypothetical protein